MRQERKPFIKRRCFSRFCWKSVEDWVYLWPRWEPHWTGVYFMPREPVVSSCSPSHNSLFRLFAKVLKDNVRLHLLGHSILSMSGVSVLFFKVKHLPKQWGLHKITVFCGFSSSTGIIFMSCHSHKILMAIFYSCPTCCNTSIFHCTHFCQACRSLILSSSIKIMLTICLIHSHKEELCPFTQGWSVKSSLCEFIKSATPIQPDARQGKLTDSAAHSLPAKFSCTAPLSFVGGLSIHSLSWAAAVTRRQPLCRELEKTETKTLSSLLKVPWPWLAVLLPDSILDSPWQASFRASPNSVYYIIAKLRPTAGALTERRYVVSQSSLSTIVYIFL